MYRREFLKLGAVAGGTVLLGGAGHFGSIFDAPKEIPTIDRLVLTNLVDNIYDVFAKGGKIGNLTITRNTLPFPYGSDVSLLSEHGLAFHLQSFRGAEEKQILLDFALTPGTLTNNFKGLKVDPAKADALIISHGHVAIMEACSMWHRASMNNADQGSLSMREGAIPSVIAGSCNRTGKNSTTVSSSRMSWKREG